MFMVIWVVTVAISYWVFLVVSKMMAKQTSGVLRHLIGIAGVSVIGGVMSSGMWMYFAGRALSYGVRVI